MERESLHIDIQVGESISIDNGRVVLTLEHKSGQRARLRFSAEKAVLIEPVRERAGSPGLPGAVELAV